MIDHTKRNQTIDIETDEACPVCDTQMVNRKRTTIPFSRGSRTFQAEWYHCPKCNCMRKMIDGAARERTPLGIAKFHMELVISEDPFADARDAYDMANH